MASERGLRACPHNNAQRPNNQYINAHFYQIYACLHISGQTRPNCFNWNRLPQIVRVNIRYTGTHVLRHSAAMRMRCAGASLKEIADVLRHRSLDTTRIYTKVDLPGLAAVAAPWPGGLS